MNHKCCMCKKEGKHKRDGCEEEFYLCDKHLAEYNEMQKIGFEDRGDGHERIL